MSAKKAKEEGKGTAKKSAGKSVRISKKRVDMARVRENINNMVGNSAEKIATAVINVAMTGQPAQAKYLFEAVGLYPATEETAAAPVTDSMAYILLKRMGLPVDPVVTDEDQEPAVLGSDAKRVGAETSGRSVAEEEPEAGGEEE